MDDAWVAEKAAPTDACWAELWADEMAVLWAGQLDVAWVVGSACTKVVLKVALWVFERAEMRVG